jgi:hypothetical protein
MKKTPFATEMLTRWPKPRRQGATRPVLLTFDPQAELSRACHAELLGKELPSRGAATNSDTALVFEACDTARAADLLRRHGGLRAAADLEDELLPEVDWLLVELKRRSIAMTAASGDSVLLETAYPCPLPAAGGMPPGTASGAADPSRWTLETGLGPCLISGRTARDVFWAAPIVSLAAAFPGVTEWLPFEGCGLPAVTRVTETLIRDLIRKRHADEPRPVAEALRVLRDLSPRSAGLVERLLDGDPDLRALREAAGRELGRTRA